MEAEVATVIKFSEEDEKNLQTPTELFNYLKTKYGVPGTENKAIADTIYESVEIMIPGFPKNDTEDNRWQIHLEKFDEDNFSGKNHSLILGEINRTRSHSWSRVMQIESKAHDDSQAKTGPYYARCRYNIVAYNLLEKGHQNTFEAVTVFMGVMNEFLKQY